MRINRGLLGWGTFFIIVGAIPLAVRGGLLAIDAVAGWPSLWPLILIGWGIGLLLRRTPIDWIGGAITAITFGIMGGGLIATGLGSVGAFTACSDTASSIPFATRSGTLGERASVRVELPCGSLRVTTSDGSDWQLDGRDGSGTGPRLEATANGVRIDTDWPGRRRTLFDPRTEWNLVLPRTPVLDLGITVNAGEGGIDLAGATIDVASFTINAGEIRLDGSQAARLARVSGTINAGSGHLLLGGGSAVVSATVNAGSLDVCVPAGAAIRVRSTTTLGSHNLDSLGLTKLGSDTWTTAGYDGAAESIDLSVTANAGSFTLTIGGSCGA